MNTDYTLPSQPLRLIYDGQYDYQGLWRYPSHCWLRVYAPQSVGDLPVVIEAQMPDNPGTSITSVAERLSWKIAHDPVIWASAPGAGREGCIWIQLYPKEQSINPKKPFSVVTFTYSEAAEEDAGSAGTLTFLSENPDDPRTIGIEETLPMPAAGVQGTLGEPHWDQVTLELVEQVLGQPFVPLPGF